MDKLNGLKKKKRSEIICTDDKLLLFQYFIKFLLLFHIFKESYYFKVMLFLNDDISLVNTGPRQWAAPTLWYKIS